MAVHIKFEWLDHADTNLVDVFQAKSMAELFPPAWPLPATALPKGISKHRFSLPQQRRRRPSPSNGSSLPVEKFTCRKFPKNPPCEGNYRSTMVHIPTDMHHEHTEDRNKLLSYKQTNTHNRIHLKSASSAECTHGLSSFVPPVRTRANASASSARRCSRGT